MDNDEAITLEIDTAGMEQRLEKKMQDMTSKIEEMVTNQPVPQSVSATQSAPAPFDYRIGVAKWLGNALGTNKSLMNEHGKVASIPKNFDVGFNADSNLREYKLKESAPLIETIGSINPDCCIPEVWADDVDRTHVYPGSVFWGAWFVRWERGIENKPGDTVWICTVGTAIATTIAAECAEPTTTGASIDCKSIGLTDYVCAYYMCKNDIESVQPDLINELNAGLGSCLERQIDNYFFDVARTNGCTAGTVSSGSALSGSLIAEAMGSMRNGTYEPVVLIVHPVAMSSLLQDTNFVYACRYGNRDVITGGRVLEWLNLQILMVPKGTLSIGSGSYDSLLLAKNALAGAIKHGLRIESEYVVRLQRRYVLATIKFGGTCLHPDGIWWIRSTDDA